MQNDAWEKHRETSEIVMLNYYIREALDGFNRAA